MKATIVQHLAVDICSRHHIRVNSCELARGCCLTWTTGEALGSDGLSLVLTGSSRGLKRILIVVISGRDLSVLDLRYV